RSQPDGDVPGRHSARHVHLQRLPHGARDLRKRAMPEYLLERYASHADSGAERARREAERMTRDGTLVRLLRSSFVPGDETCFDLYEAESLEAVQEAARRAELRVDRISRSIGGEGARGPEGAGPRAGDSP